MHSSDGRERRCIESVHHVMNPLMKVTYSGERGVLLHPLHAAVELAQITARTEPATKFAVENERVSMLFNSCEGCGKLLQFLERLRSDLVARLATQRDFNHAVCQLPGERFAGEYMHRFLRVLLGSMTRTTHTACFTA